MRPPGFLGTALLFLVLVGLPQAGVAGTGQLLSRWMSQAPAIDGAIGAGEWSEATAIDLGAGVTARVGNDGQTLYLLLLDFRPGEPSGDRMILFFDDEGGTVPWLDDGTWTTPDCHFDPALGEGEIWFETGGAVDFYEWWSSGASSGYCPAQALGSRQSSAIGDDPWLGLIYELALPLDGSAPLHGAPGQRLGFQLRAVDAAAFGEVCYPSCSLDPSEFRNLLLASAGENLLFNPEFSAELLSSGWMVYFGSNLDWTAQDSTGCPGSGSGQVESATLDTGAQWAEVGQCQPIDLAAWTTGAHAAFSYFSFDATLAYANFISYPDTDCGAGGEPALGFDSSVGTTGPGWHRVEISVASLPPSTRSLFVAVGADASQPTPIELLFDRAYFGKIPALFSDGFETAGTLCRWSTAIP